MIKAEPRTDRIKLQPRTDGPAEVSQEWIITGDYRHAHELPGYESVRSPNPWRSGVEFCTVDGRRFERYDCFASFSPYGWYEVEGSRTTNDLAQALRILNHLDYGQRLGLGPDLVHEIDTLLARYSNLMQVGQGE